MHSIVSWHPMGRLGNWLFMAAAAFAYAMDHKLGFSAPKWTNDGYWNPLYMPHLQNPAYEQNSQRVTLTEKEYTYNELPWDEDWRWRNIMLIGYFQSWKYYDKYRLDLIKAFDLPWKHQADVCSVHARFGDYLTIPGKHILMSETYLREAMRIITKETNITKFKVFSDDIRYFKEHFGHIANFEYSETGDIMQDLIEGSWCHSHINSASTFSYWMAELNQNPDKVVVCQENFYQPGFGGLDTSDVLRPEWIKISEN